MPFPFAMKAILRPLANLTFIFTFLVILAGSVVRITGSGMGCPDWPKCFGYYIPPTDPDQVNYHVGQEYKKGMMVIVNDTLWRAKSGFVAQQEFDRGLWEKYPKHDYAEFIVYQTWVEYINRLLGAVLGLFVLGCFVSSLFWWRTDKLLPLYAFALLFLTGFQAWLGKLVVDGNLIPQSISIHMLAALLLLVFAQFILMRLRVHAGNATPLARNIRLLSGAALLLTVLQVLVGTQVREEIDVLAKMLGSDQRDLWVDGLSSVFTLHKSASLMVLALNGFLIYQVLHTANDRARRMAALLGGLLFLEVVLGIVLNYAGMPGAAQTLHLLCATLIFAAQAELVLGR